MLVNNLFTNKIKKIKLEQGRNFKCKKIQIMLPLWLSDYLELQSERFDLSISEFARLHICFSIISHTSNLFREYKTEIPLKEISKKTLEYMETEEREDFFRFISEIYFEARKAAKFRLDNTEHELS